MSNKYSKFQLKQSSLSDCIFEEGYEDNKQYSISKSIKHYKIVAEQTRTSETSEVGSGAMEE